VSTLSYAIDVLTAFTATLYTGRIVIGVGVAMSAIADVAYLTEVRRW
jgi:hypothetical protein